MRETFHKKKGFFYGWALALKLAAFFPPLAAAAVLGRDFYGWTDCGVDAALLAGGLLLAFLESRLLSQYEAKHPRKLPEFDREVLGQVRQARFDVITSMTLLAYVTSFVFLLAIACLIYGWLNGIFTGLVLFFCWIRVFRAADQGYTGLVSLLEYLISGFIYLAFLAFLSLLRSVFGLEFICRTEPLLAVFALYTVSMGFLINQANLDRTMDSMKHSKASLPQKIRRYNAFIVSGVIALLLVGFLFRSQLAGLVEWLGNALLTAVLLVIVWLTKLLSIGPPVSGGEGEDVAGPPPGESIFQAKGNPYYDLILLLFLVGAVVFLVSPPGRRLLKRIAGIPKRVFRALLRWISPQSKQERAEGASAFYTDFVEDLPESAEESTAASNDGRRFKKRTREWRKLSDPIQKVRAGYTLARDYAGLQGVEFTPADTVREAEKKVGAKPFSENGALYERVRYAGRQPSEKELDRFSANVEQFLKERSK
ncbi:MAG: hypothetical protein HFJ85_01915 [Oscillospiraceae bacterium]|nr:hypothetical protein [Oscillospiraceae bacterium]